MAQTKGVSAYLEIDGREFEGRDFAWQSDVLQLSDQFSAIVPAPNGKAVTVDNKRVPVAEIKEGALVKFRVSDPEVEDGAKLLKLTGRLVDIDDGEDDRGGFQLRLSGYDLGWHLTTGHGQVFKNYRGVKWAKFLEQVIDPSWGFAGVRSGNLENLRTRIGPRAALEAARFKGTKEGGTPQPGAIQPRFQIEVGQSVGPLFIELAKFQRYLVNVSADGYLQFFQPTTSSSPFYYFHHETSEEERRGFPVNNVRNSRLRRSASGLYTRTECWTSIVTPPANADTDNPNFGRYMGAHDDPDLLAFKRRNTFSDTNQLGKSRAAKRAKWAHDRGVFDSWEYRFRVKGHSQDGMPYEPDTIASLRDAVRGIEGNFYVQSVRCSRILAAAGLSPDAGTWAELVLRKPNLLGA